MRSKVKHMAAGKVDEDGCSHEWRYCSVCRRNHDQGRKHIFTKQHKNRLSVILSKFTKKVRSARRVLEKPSVLDGELEPGAKMWCYCCEREIDKHVTDGCVSLEWGGLIEHMADPAHHKKTRHYWWFNGAESNQLQMFLLFPAEYRRYREQAAEVLKAVHEESERRRKKVAEERELKQTTSLPASSTFLEPLSHFSVGPPGQSSWNQHGGLMPHPLQQPGSSGLPRPSGSSMATTFAPSSTSQSRPSAVKVTVGAFGDNLTTIKRKEPVNGKLGNVHSGATPPWLRGDDDDKGTSPSSASSVTFGPSLDEFIKHKERMRRAGKNPKRVGADFHLKLAAQKVDSDDWLPSFGRVWNFGPRGHSKAEFLKESTKKKSSKMIDGAGPSNTSSSMTESSTPLATNVSSDLSTSSLPKVKPYVRKRMRSSDGRETISEQCRTPDLNSTTSLLLEGGADKDLNHVTSSDLDSEPVKVKPYVRKRKIMSK